MKSDHRDGQRNLSRVRRGNTTGAIGLRGRSFAPLVFMLGLGKLELARRACMTRQGLEKIERGEWRYAGYNRAIGDCARMPNR